MSKKSLQIAKNNQCDEFYTKYETVAAEIPFYEEYLRNRVVYCNCDNPKFSNVWRYLSDNFTKLGLKKLIATYYDKTSHSYKTEKYISKNGNVRTRKTPLKGNGDYASPECLRILDLCDVVITNPMWSSASEFIKTIYDHNKKFLVLGNQNVLTDKKLMDHLINQEIFIGVSIHKGGTEFVIPDEYPQIGKTARIDTEGKRCVSVTSTRWITNLNHNHFPDPLKMHTSRWNLKNVSKLQRKLLDAYGTSKYPKYDNENAIEVPFSDCIPSDRRSKFGVPISFLDKYNPAQFEIVGVRKGKDGKDLSINGVTPYFRLLIQRKEVA